jgi:crossover junction endonuclease EME1
LAEAYWEWENAIIIVTGAEAIVDKVLHGGVTQWIQDARLMLGLDAQCQILVVVRGLAQYHAKTRTLANREFTAMARAGLESNHASASSSLPVRPYSDTVERDLVDLQVQEGVYIVQGERPCITLALIPSGEDGRNGRLDLEFDSRYSLATGEIAMRC